MQIAARDPLSDPNKELERQEALKKLVFAVAQPGAVEFDNLLDKVLQYASELFVSPATPRPTSDGENVHEDVAKPHDMEFALNFGGQFGLTDATSDTALKFQGSLAF